MDRPKKTPLNHEWRSTDDGTLTLFSMNYQESCHSTAGAKNETQFHYIEGCSIVETYKTRDSFTLLEVGFGTGLGLELTVQALRDQSTKPARLISTEIDESLVEFLIAESSFPYLKNLQKNGYYYQGKFEQFEIIILVGDARKTVPQFFSENNILIDAIYQDAFSPRRNPDLWTVEWFSDLKKISHQEVKLSTYSSSSSMRKSLVESGWKITKGPKFGEKRSSTRATLQGTSHQEILDHLARSPVSAITDATCAEFKNGNTNDKK